MVLGNVTTDWWSPVSNKQPLRDTRDRGFQEPALRVESITSSLSAVAFWLAIALPVFYIPFLMTGIHGLRELGVFLGVFALHLGALYAGHSYHGE
jgi:hypothetical protein